MRFPHGSHLLVGLQSAVDPAYKQINAASSKHFPGLVPSANEQSMHNLRQTRARLTDSLLARFENGRGNVSPETSSNFPSALPPFA